MNEALIIGLASIFVFFAILVKIGVLVYFFILLHRLIKAVERIEQRCGGIEAALRAYHEHNSAIGEQKA